MQIDLVKKILGSARSTQSRSVSERIAGAMEKGRQIKALFLYERERPVTVTTDRAYVAYRGVTLTKLNKFNDAVKTIAAQNGIQETYINPYTKRVMMHPSGDMPPRTELEGIVRAAEREIGAAPIDDPAEMDRALPDDPQVQLQYTVEAVIDIMGLALGLSLKLVPVIPRAVGSNMYTALFLVSVVPGLRRELDIRLGKERADLLLNVGFALALSLAERPLTSMVQILDKVENLRELRARTALWEKIRSSIIDEDVPVDLTQLTIPRPAPLPYGPIERYDRRAKVVAACTFGFSLMATRNPLRAIPAAFAALPYPAYNGRDIFTAELGRIFAKRGMLVLAPNALRRLDRVDCLVIPSDVVARDQFKVSDAFALKDISREAALEAARNLFHPDHPLRVYREGETAVGPIRVLAPFLDWDLEAELAKRTRRGAFILGLSIRDSIVALLEVHITSKSSAREAIRKANKVGMKLVLATDDLEVADNLSDLKVDDVIGLNSGLADGIRSLQEEGHTVCFLGSGPDDGFNAADLSVAIRVEGQPFPWSAHVVCPESSRLVDTILDAASMAKLVSRQSAGLALVAASMGALASTSGNTFSASGRVVSVMSGASLAAMINGVHRSMSVGLKPNAMRDPTPWHALEIDGVLARLGTDGSGLASLPKAEKKKRIDLQALLALARAVKLELSNPLTPLLAVGAGVSALVGSKADAGIVAGVGLINGIIGGYQRFRAERAITALVKTAETMVRVQRGESEEICPAGELRRGDVVLLSQGDVVPADCRIISAEALEVDTSPLTGESFPVPKSADPCFAENVADISSMIYSGNIIAAGHAKAVVVAKGEDTVMARAALLTVTDEARGGVEARLRELMSLTGPVTVGAGVILVLSSMLRGKKVTDLVSTGVGLAVAAVPEGLPVLATAAQLAASERLSKRGALVKNPRAIEALGRIDMLCMDKTGTLTEGRIELTSIHTGQALEPVEQISEEGESLLLSAARAVVREKGLSIDPMDAAIDRAINTHMSFDVEAGWKRIAERAFESARGFEAILGRTDEGPIMCVKGAPELILEQSTAVRREGRPSPIDDLKESLQNDVEQLTSMGLRVIAVGERIVDEAALASADPGKLLDAPKDLVFRGLIAFRDPVRPTAKAAIRKLDRAGVNVVMITGDHPSTAERIAKEVDLIKGGKVLRGAAIAEMTDEELDRAVIDTSVYARVTPAQKVRVVRALQRMGRIVGMVGDGANDAAAMRAADAGIAVGLRSTDAAKAAADIVLRDARIDELFEAIVEGRAMWRSVRNAVSILIGGNFGEIAFSVAVGALTGSPPLSPRQLLVVNFLTDIAPSTAIALRPPSLKDLHKLRELSPKAALGSPLNREIVTRAVTTSIGAWSAWAMGRMTGSSARASTISLLGLVGSQLGQTLLSGGKSRSVIITGIGSFAVLAGMVQIPGLSHALGCTPLGPVGWGLALSASAGSTLASPIIEAVVNRTADIWTLSTSGTRINTITQSSLELVKNLLVI